MLFVKRGVTEWFTVSGEYETIVDIKDDIEVVR